MLELRFRRGGLLKETTDAIKEFISEPHCKYPNFANFTCSNRDGLSLSLMDTSHISLFEMLLSIQSFDVYICERTSIIMGVDLLELAMLMQMVSNEDTVTISLEDEDVDYLTFSIENPNNGKEKQFQIMLWDIKTESFPVPKLKYEATVKMPSQEFARIISYFKSIDNEVTISLDKEKKSIAFSTKKENGNTATVVCKHNTCVKKPEDATVVEIERSVVEKMNSTYMHSFTKAASLSSFVTLSMSDSNPVLVEYTIAYAGYVRFHLAPKTK